MKSFFEKHRHELTLKMQSGRQKGFRVCQLGAVWAAKSHFTASSSRALINLPTGAGKTAVMMTLAFEFGARRVFVLTPSIFIREQIAAEFRSLRQLIQDIGALPRKFEPRLEVCEVLNELQSAADWKDLLKFDVVVATPNVVRAGEPPSELFVSPEAGASGFDLVFIDEAHHSAAQTWSEFLHLTRDARTILFTATPFRRDRKRIHAELIYTYPISKAIRDGIYRPVRYVPVDEPDRQRRHTRLAEACAAELFQIRKKDPTATFIAKAERIADMDGLLATYKAAGFDGSRIDVVHSEKSADHNRQVLKRVAANKGTKRDEGGLDGFICVDSGSEGIDVGTLRIAVFHDTPRTLPYTIQIIGRITRRNHDRFGDAVLIADPRVARGTDVHDLYYSDPAGWNDLLPQLFEDYVMRSKFSPFPGTVFAGVASIPADDLSPYLAVRVYQRLSASRASGSPLADSLSEDALRTQDTDSVSLDEYLNDFPPLIVLTSGATIRDELLFKPRIQSQRIDPEVIEAQDWSDTDITKEAKPPDPKYRVNVQDRTVELIRDQYILGTGDMLVCDDRANEVADFVLFQGGMRKRVTFFHCKYKKSDGDSRRPEPGVRKGDLVELTDQAVRTGHWIGADNLGKRLSERIGGDTKLMIHGTVRQLQQLAASFAPDEWSYAVVIVQPGLHRKQLLGRANPSQCEQLLTVIYDRIVTDYGARFSVWTS